MNKKMLFAAILFVSAGAYAYNTKSFGGWPFSAPHVSDKDSLDSGYAQEGDIVYDETDNVFYGKNNSAWIEFGGAGPSNLVTTSDSQEWGVESASISSAGVVSVESGDWISGSCSISDTSLFTCTINTSIFSSAPNCFVSIVTSITGSDQVARISQDPTSTSVVIRTGASTELTGFSKIAYPFKLFCQGPR